ncbi:MAG TPA: glucoamylase family protein [Bacillota bacterium]|nr:glucoamylase family protein [Bacillota bacterium]
MCQGPARGRFHSRLFYVQAILVFIAISLIIPTRSVLANFAPVASFRNHEASKLVLLDDDELLDFISKRAFDYFWHEANPHNGLIPYCNAADSPCSVAVVGLGLTAIPVGIERGWISREEGYQRAVTTLSTLRSDSSLRENGFFYQLLDMDECSRFKMSKASSIDTTILIAGALFIGEFFSQTVIQDMAYDLYDAVNWQWMMNHGETLTKSWTPEAGFSKERWDSFDESLLMYILAMGSPTYPIPASTWHKIRRPVRENYIFAPEESLASYILPHIWLDLRGKEDFYANYWNNAEFAARYNRIYSMLKQNKSKSYTKDIWGLSECEGPKGYQVYGASASNYDGTFAPYATIGCIPFSSSASMQTIRGILRDHGDSIWGKYGFFSGFNLDRSWWSATYHGIGQGICLLMIENYRTGLIWKHIAHIPPIQRGLRYAEFRASKISEALTPAYTAEVEGKHPLWDF